MSPRDLAQLVTLSLSTPIGFGVYTGVSANTRQVFSIHNGRDELGYVPVDNAEEHLGSIDSTIGDAVGCFGAVRNGE